MEAPGPNLIHNWFFFQGPKGEPGKNEIVDYNGNINKALQVKNPNYLISITWGSNIVQVVVIIINNNNTRVTFSVTQE